MGSVPERPPGANYGSTVWQRGLKNRELFPFAWLRKIIINSHAGRILVVWPVEVVIGSLEMLCDCRWARRSRRVGNRFSQLGLLMKEGIGY